MENCEFGCLYPKQSKADHDESVSCAYSFYKYLCNKRDRGEIDKNTNNRIICAKKSIDNATECGKCDFESSDLKELLEHEAKCIGIKIDLDSVNQVKLYSNKSVTCKICKKTFLHTCKTSTPRHQLNRHTKVCEKALSRNLKQQIKESLKDLDLETLKDIVSLLPKF